MQIMYFYLTYSRLNKNDAIQALENSLHPILTRV